VPVMADARRNARLRPEDEKQFSACWNEGRFFEAHETLEPRWIATRDRGLRGLIQLAAALHHLSKANLKGARITLERAIVRLLDPDNAPCGFDEKALADFASGLLQRLDTTSPEALIASRPRL